MSQEFEWQTRRDRINTKLKALNPAWNIVKYRPELETSTLNHHAIEEFPTANGPADYALFVNLRLMKFSRALFYRMEMCSRTSLERLSVDRQSLTEMM